MLKGLMNRWQRGREEKEIRSFRERLETLSDEELGTMLASASDMRHNLLREQGDDLLQPYSVIEHDRHLPLKMAGFANQLVMSNNQFDANPVLLWTHTLRAAVTPELKPEAVAIWREMRRGHPHLEAGAAVMEDYRGRRPQMEGAERIPVGFAGSARRDIEMQEQEQERETAE